VSDDPFWVLGLPARADVTDDDVRAAWRRIAAATHPDRDDGGDPARFGAAAAAYAMLRTGWDRGEALAELGPSAQLGPSGPSSRPRARARLLALRVAATAAVCAAVFAAAGWAPASIGVAAGALTWLALTARHDLPPRPRR
jgi:curved DNA-binding protein CbpA